ncbi:MAG: SufE family protein [Gammaproteobacteria bacterium]|nr:SufE family protein [Gammaproteobacteria bacterium]
MQTLPYPFSESTLGIDFKITDALDSFSKSKDWVDRYRQLFKLADRNIPIEDQWRKDEYLVEGCESPVWLMHHFDARQQRHFIIADSDSKIIKGLLVLILCNCNGQSSDTILEFNLEPMLVNLDFGKYLTPSRTSGLLTVINKIKNSVINLLNSNIEK